MSNTDQKTKKNFTYNTATFSGCVDIIVVEKSDKSLRSSPIGLTIGNFKMMNSANKVITVKVNGFECKHKLFVNGQGEAYFQNTEPKVSNFEHSTYKFGENDIQEAKTPLETSQDLKSKNPFQLYSEKDNISVKHEIEVSICAHLMKQGINTPEMNNIFDRNRVTYQEFKTNNSEILNNPNLMIRIDGKIFDNFVGIPRLLSLNLFQKKSEKQLGSEIKGPNPSKRNTEYSNGEYQTRKPPSDMYEEVCLHPGKNEVKFIFEGNFGKEYQISTRLFYYPYKKNYRVIVSDIDGTVTRSDVLGHLMPMVNQDWTHDGIAHLYSNLANRGYIFIYLSARNIGLSKRTKKYLESIYQEGSRMPEGPVMTSYEGLFESLNRELIQKKPHIFKIKIMKEIFKIFEEYGKNPFYSGFGNKETDAIAYTTLSIETKRIFTINEKSQIKVLRNGYTVNFTDLNQTIDETFPEFNLHIDEEETDYFEVEKRNKTVVNKVQQSLKDKLFKG